MKHTPISRRDFSKEFRHKPGLALFLLQALGFLLFRR